MEPSGCQPTRRQPPEPCGRGRIQTQAAVRQPATHRVAAGAKYRPDLCGGARRTSHPRSPSSRRISFVKQHSAQSTVRDGSAMASYVDSERSLPPLLRLLGARRSSSKAFQCLGIDLTPHRGPSAQTGSRSGAGAHCGYRQRHPLRPDLIRRPHYGLRRHLPPRLRLPLTSRSSARF